ncbi:MAG: hypothetical protein H6734_13400 [Alphaproteobacteria bacterium]|nr:hypothetical protein [Alphaproteobacteria bacterium]
MLGWMLAACSEPIPDGLIEVSEIGQHEGAFDIDASTERDCVDVQSAVLGSQLAGDRALRRMRRPLLAGGSASDIHLDLDDGYDYDGGQLLFLFTVDCMQAQDLSVRRMEAVDGDLFVDLTLAGDGVGCCVDWPSYHVGVWRLPAGRVDDIHVDMDLP